MPKKQIKKIAQMQSIETLLNEQTLTILNAVDERLVKTEARIDAKMDQKLLEMEARFNQKLVSLEARFDEKIAKMEERMNQKFDKLTITLDNFLKRTLDNEDEMEIMKLDIIRLKKVIKEKIGVDLT